MINTDNLITVLWTVPIIGTNGTEKYFLQRHQYEVSGTINITVSCPGCGVTNTQVKTHFIININGESFYLDADNAAFEGRERADWETDWNIYREKKPWEPPKQYNRVYKEVYGIDRIKASQRQDNGYEIAKQLGLLNENRS